MRALLNVAKAAVAGVVALKVAQHTETVLAKGGTLAGKAVAAGKRRLKEARARR